MQNSTPNIAIKFIGEWNKLLKGFIVREEVFESVSTGPPFSVFLFIPESLKRLNQQTSSGHCQKPTPFLGWNLV
jgi:hypothetical protein